MKILPVLIGLSKINAMVLLSRNHVNYRVLREDNSTYTMASSFVANRVNLIIVDGVIASYNIG